MRKTFLLLIAAAEFAALPAVADDHKRESRKHRGQVEVVLGVGWPGAGPYSWMDSKEWEKDRRERQKDLREAWREAEKDRREAIREWEKAEREAWREEQKARAEWQRERDKAYREAVREWNKDRGGNR